MQFGNLDIWVSLLFLRELAAIPLLGVDGHVGDRDGGHIVFELDGQRTLLGRQQSTDIIMRFSHDIDAINGHNLRIVRHSRVSVTVPDEAVLLIVPF